MYVHDDKQYSAYITWGIPQTPINRKECVVIMKEERIEIRLSVEDKNYLNELCEYYSCNKTTLITELIRRGEFTQVNYEGIDKYLSVFGRIGSNINQIARALNIIKNTNVMNEEQYQEIMNNFKTIKSIYETHQFESREMLKKIYKIKREKKRYKISDEFEIDS